MTDRCGPRWRIDVPRSWTVRCGSGLVVAASAPGPHVAVTPHVVVGHEWLPAGLRLDAVAARARDDMADIADRIEDLGSARGDDGRLERFTRIVAFTARRTGAEVAQILALVAPRAPDAGGTREVIQVVGTCAFDDLDRHGPVFAGIVESIRPHR